MTGRTDDYEWLLALGFPLYPAAKAEIMQFLAQMLYVAFDDNLASDVDRLIGLIETEGNIIFESIERNWGYWNTASERRERERDR